MTLYKDVQKKAQAEIETLCGAGHLPSIHDVDRYPYIMATMLELLRWQVPAPFGKYSLVIYLEDLIDYKVSHTT